MKTTEIYYTNAKLHKILQTNTKIETCRYTTGGIKDQYTTIEDISLNIGWLFKLSYSNVEMDWVWENGEIISVK
jgi:hypothetical protein